MYLGSMGEQRRGGCRPAPPGGGRRRGRPVTDRERSSGPSALFSGFLFASGTSVRVGAREVRMPPAPGFPAPFVPAPTSSGRCAARERAGSAAASFPVTTQHSRLD